MIEIDESAAGQRIDNFLLRVCKGVPKSHIYRILRSGEVRVNKGRIDAAVPSRTGRSGARAADPHRATRRSAGSSTAPAAEFPIIFEDDHLLVIDKPAGVAVHGGSGVAFGVIEQMRDGAAAGEIPGTGASAGPRDVRRADARQEALGARQSARADSREQMDKRYYACVHGEWASDWGRRRAVKAPLHKYLAGDGERRVRVQEDGLRVAYGVQSDRPLAGLRAASRRN